METTSEKRIAFLLLFSVFVIATCGLVYELLAGTLASYLLGDSITQFSTVIGAYMFAMGLGSWASRYVQRNLLSVFIRVELLIAIIGGCSAAALFIGFEWVSEFRLLLYGEVTLIGILVGLEIPLLMRILENRFVFKDLISRVFTFDYIGALLASVLFPLVMMPQLGLMRTGFFVGMLNVAVAIWTIFFFRKEIAQFNALLAAAVISLGILILGMVFANSLQRSAEGIALGEPIIFAQTSPYQRVVLTRSREAVKLYLNGNLQFSSRDEYRYHEALVHPPMASGKNPPKRVLVLGGGDGLAVREILKYPSVENITLVDLDASVTALFTRNAQLRSLNGAAFLSPKVHVIHADAFTWLAQQNSQYDVVIVDFPDPSNFSVGKLYTLTFYERLKKVLAPAGRIVVQSTSPYVARKSFWCVDATLREANFTTVPYHAYVPSFGEWGYVMAYRSTDSLPELTHVPAGLRYFSPATFRDMCYFPADMAPLPTVVNRLNNQQLVQYFEAEWGVY